MIEPASFAAVRSAIGLLATRCTARGQTTGALAATLISLMFSAPPAQSATDGIGQQWVTGQLSKAPPPLESPVAGRAFAFRNVVQPSAGSKVTPTQAKAWEEQLREIAAYLSGQPLLKAPRGFYPELSGFIDVLSVGRYLQTPSRAPLVGGVTFAAWTPEAVTIAADSTPKKKPHHLRSLRIELNYLHPPRGEPWMNDADGGFGAVHVQGTYAGFPLIEDMLVVTRDGRLPFVAVSQERALKAFVAYWTTKVVELDAIPLQPGRAPSSSPAAPIRAAIRAAEAKLASMSAAERARPASVRDQRATPAEDRFGIGLVGEREGHALMALDDAFFDPAGPRHRVRIAAVRELQRLAEAANGRDHGPGTVDARAALMLFQQIDWQDFARRFVQAR